MYNKSVDFSELVGKTITKIVGGDRGDSLMEFHCDNGEVYRMSHSQDCCESVFVAEIIGDLKNLIGERIEIAYKSTQDMPMGEEDWGIGMWTFYNLSTNKDSSTIRWNGSSNGYYSIGVDFELLGDEGEW